MQLKLPLPPPLNSIYKIGKGRMYKAQEAKDYTEEVGWLLKQKKVKKYEGKVDLDIMFHITRDRDIDSGLKVLLDALEGRLYENDKQVYGLKVQKLKADEPATYLIHTPYVIGSAAQKDIQPKPDKVCPYCGSTPHDHKKSEPF